MNHNTFIGNHIQKEVPGVRKYNADSISWAEVKFPGTIQGNYDDFLNHGLIIGIEPYPTREIIDSITITSECRGKQVTFDVRYEIVGLNEKSTTTLHVITTTRINRPTNLIREHGRCSYIDEAKTMCAGIIQMAKKGNDILNCTK